MLSAPVLWFAAGIFCFVLEALAPIGVLIFFGLGCLGAWVAALAALSVKIQVLSFAAITIVSLLLLRKKLSSVFSGSKSDKGVSTSVLGQIATVSQALQPELEGQVFVQGSYWRAKIVAQQAHAGEKVRVCGADKEDATLLLVERL